MNAPGLRRWRLILGESAEDDCGALAGDDARRDAALDWLYEREAARPGEEDRDLAGTRGGSEASALRVPEWIDAVQQLFPKESIERMERDAVTRYRIDELVTNEEALRRAVPNAALLEAVLRVKHLMNPRVREMARSLVAKVVREIQQKMAREVRRSLAGPRQRRRSRRASASLLDARSTIRANLRHWDPARRRLVIERPLFVSRRRRDALPWHVIVLVDQSGSMVPSVIHAAVMASCLWSVPGLSTRLIAFDTAVVDLTGHVEDPAELLMRVQLGGGTHIGEAVSYAAGLVEAPRRTVVVIVSDFFEGGSPALLVARVRALCAEGVRVLGLAALDEVAEPRYDRDLARHLVEAGAEVAAMTPGQLASWLAEVLGR